MKKRKQIDQLNTVLTPQKSVSKLLHQNSLSLSHTSTDLEQSLLFAKGLSYEIRRQSAVSLQAEEQP